MKTSDSYDSLIRGVSEQVPHDRIVGQHWSQDNLVSDPVRGMSRRHGSEMRHYLTLGTAVIRDVEKQDAANRAEQSLFVDGQEYALFYRKSRYDSYLQPIYCVNKTTNKIIPVNLVDDTAIDVTGEGLSCITAAGRLVLAASAVRKVQSTSTDNMLASNDKHLVWVRGGVNSRTFTVFVTIDGVVHSYAYETQGAYYNGVLDTSDIPVFDPPGSTTPNPQYAKLVNDRVNAYNTAVNQYLSIIAKDISPENIASKLAALIAVDIPGTVSSGPYVLIQRAGIIVSADDGGNGELMRAVSVEVTAPENVSPRHFPGKVVRVVPRQAGALAYYLQAVSVNGDTNFGEVTWRECPGINITLDWVFLMGIFHDGALWLASTSAGLAAATGTTIPTISPSSCGDETSSPKPEFFDRLITHMQMFQDRLMIVAGSTVFLSKSGDYFNFFRKSALTLADDDPIEVFAQGTEDDVITTGVQHDRNVILCGQRFQYMVPGSQAMTPRNPYVGVLASYEGGNLAPHAVAGSLLFFCQRREKRLTLQQMVPGVVADRLDAFDVSSQLDGYLTGTPRQIVAMTAPGIVFVRTAELTNGFYVYSYLDANGQTERLFDSWSRWTMDPQLGALMGISQDDSALLSLTIRNTAAGPALVLDRFVRETEPSEFPYLDSHQAVAESIHLLTPTTCVAYDKNSVRHLIGTTLDNVTELTTRFPTETQFLHAGTLFDSEVVLTSPYIRDQQDKIILDARLTVTKLTVSLSNSSAVLADVTYDRGATWKRIVSWIARPLGAWVLNTQPVQDGAVITVPIMKDNKIYRARLSARSWLPLTMSVVEWAGQVFTTRRR